MAEKIQSVKTWKKNYFYQAESHQVFSSIKRWQDYWFHFIGDKRFQKISKDFDISLSQFEM